MYKSHGNVEILVSTRAGTGSYPGGAGVMNVWAGIIALKPRAVNSVEESARKWAA
jgi:hypothetical protein